MASFRVLVKEKLMSTLAGSESNGHALKALPAGVETEGRVMRLPKERVRPMPNQPRKKFVEAKIVKLSKSIRRIGQRLPIVVVAVTDDPSFDWQIVDGERRQRAINLIPDLAYIRAVEKTDDVDEYLASVVSNFCQEKHTPMEIALACAELRARNFKWHDVAETTGMGEQTVQSYVRLLELEDSLQDLTDPDTPRDKRLRFAAALELTRLKKDVQLKVYTAQARKKQLGISAIRKAVAHELQDPGTRNPDLRVRNRKPSDYIGMLMTRLRSALGNLNGAFDLPFDTMRQNFQTSTKRELAELFENLFTAVEDLDDKIRGESRQTKKKA